MSDLVGNPEDRFSRDTAHTDDAASASCVIILIIQFNKVFESYIIIIERHQEKTKVLVSDLV